jgi:hypothetical protein
MTQTEVSLRVARFLLHVKIAAANVTVSVPAHEIENGVPQFPIERFLIEQGFVRSPSHVGGWHGSYLFPEAGEGKPSLEIALNSQGVGVITKIRLAWPVSPRPEQSVLEATVAAGGPGAASAAMLLRTAPWPPAHRFLIHTGGGAVDEVRESAEHTGLGPALVRALTYDRTRSIEVIAVAGPHSPGARALASKWRSADGIIRCSYMVLVVDRSGKVEGIPYQYYVPSAS